MAKTIVGLFDTFAEAQGAVKDLANKGFPRDAISIAANDATGEYAKSSGSSEEWSGTAAGATTGATIGGIGGLLIGLGALAIPGIGPIVAAGPLVAALTGAGIGAVAGGLIGALTDVGVPEEEAGYYAEGVRRGGTLVTINAEDSRADQAVEIMEKHNAVDVEQRASAWKQSGWTGYSPTAKPYTTDEITRERERYRTTPSTAAAGVTATSTRPTPQPARRDLSATGEKETTLPVIEEELQVGKRAVSGGGVRVYSRMTEKPVEEQVQLRTEHVSVERRPVNRALSGTDRDAFKEGTLEMTEMSEEAVVSKQARVVEEVVVRKDVQERTETVRDTVRRTDVEVEKLGAERGQSASGFEAYDAEFRQNFTGTYGSRGKNYTYEKYAPAYRYGHDLVSDKRYSGKEWSAFESDARRDWETRNPGQGTWEEVKDAVRHAWDTVRGRTARSRVA
jgi:uncharacterized protein (TIGR02271 family)